MRMTGKRTLFGIIVVIFSLAIVDFCVGLLGDQLMKMVSDYSIQNVVKDNFCLNRVDADIVIIGSSRGQNAYVPAMLRDSINQYIGKNYSLYNGAIEEKTVYASACTIESILARYSPKLIVFDITQWECSGAREKEMDYSIVNYHNNEYVKQYVDRLGVRERLLAQSNMYRFNRKFIGILASFSQPGNEDGYKPKFNKMKEVSIADTAIIKTAKPMDDYCAESVARVMKLAKDKGVLLVMAFSPMFTPDDSNDDLLELCRLYDTPCVDYYDLENFNRHPEYFNDPIHLNDDGAHLYTKMFFEAIKPYLD